VAAFERDLVAFTDTLLSHHYNGTGPPRVVLVSPIAQEAGGPAYIDVEGRNRDLERYTAAVRRAAAQQGVGFIDLFTPTHAAMTAPDARPLTENGIHLTRYGDWVVAQFFVDALDLAAPWRVTLDAADGSATAAEGTVTDVTTEDTGLSFTWMGTGSALAPPPPDASAPPTLADAQPRLVVANLEPGTYALRANGKVIAQGDHADWAAGLAVYPQDPALRPAIAEKNELFFLRWRAVNGEYIYGRRKEPFGVVNFPGEMQELETLVGDDEARIHALAAAPLRLTWRLERVEQP
jgi:hypothetical protein